MGANSDIAQAPNNNMANAKTIQVVKPNRLRDVRRYAMGAAIAW